MQNNVLAIVNYTLEQFIICSRLLHGSVNEGGFGGTKRQRWQRRRNASTKSLSVCGAIVIEVISS